VSTETLVEPTEDLPMPAATPGRGNRRRIAIVLVALLVVVLGAGATALARRTEAAKADIRAGTAIVTSAGLAARFGIDVNLIGVTAAGGLIEFRYRVVDPDKADQMIHNPTLLPVLVIEDTGETLVIGTPHHRVGALALGGTYFFLLANAHNAVHEGSLVTLVMGDVRLEHVEVQG